MTQISLLIATYNRAESLRRTLCSVAQQSLAPGEFEIVVVDNNSPDHTPQVCAEFAAGHPQLQFRRVAETRQGLSHARNCGIEAARGRYIAFIDDDEEINTGFLENYLHFFESHPQAAAAGGRMLPVYEGKLPRWFSPFLDRPVGSKLDLGSKPQVFKGKRYPIGGNMAMRRTVFERYGMFNPDLGRKGNQMLGGEEKDLFDRLRRGGEEIHYLPEAIVYHIIPESRVTKEYLRRLMPLAGASERIRTRAISPGAYLGALLSEGIKWGGTVVLLAWYVLTLRPPKGWMLMQIRWRTTQGLLGL